MKENCDLCGILTFERELTEFEKWLICIPCEQSYTDEELKEALEEKD